MQRLLNALVGWLQASSNSMSAFIGIHGPYLDVAPEGTPFPFMVYTVIPGTPNWQGFDSTYAARAHLQFSLWDVIADTVATNTEFLASKLDVLGSLTLAGNEYTRKPIRIEEPRYMAGPIEGTGQRAYGGILEYRFNVQRTRGA